MLIEINKIDEARSFIFQLFVLPYLSSSKIKITVCNFGLELHSAAPTIRLLRGYAPATDQIFVKLEPKISISNYYLRPVGTISANEFEP